MNRGRRWKTVRYKNGVEVTIITSAPHKDMGSLFRSMTEEEREIWNEMVEQIYADFVQVVVDSRELSEETVRELADGRVYTDRSSIHTLSFHPTMKICDG